MESIVRLDSVKSTSLRRGSKQQTKKGNKHSRLRKASEAEVNQWIANAVARLIAASSAIRANSIYCYRPF